MEINHRVQLLILKQLLFAPKSRFAELNILKIDNNHFNFHLKSLINKGLIEKEDIYYKLTPKGLEISGRLDTDITELIKQPKVSVLIFPILERKNRSEVLVGKRLKDPGKDKIGFFANKVRLDESLFDTAKRCLKRETGLEADFDFTGVVHFKYYKDNIPAEIVLLNCFKAKNIRGEFKKKTLESNNFWVSFSKAQKLKNFFNGFNKLLRYIKKEEIFFEEIVIRE